jgi:hypothetical protein
VCRFEERRTKKLPSKKAPEQLTSSIIKCCRGLYY